MKRVVFLAAAAATLVQFTKYDLTARQTLGCEIHMVCNMQEGNISQAALQEYNQMFPQLHWHDLPFSDSAGAVRRNHAAYEKLVPLLKELQPDLLHCRGTIAGWYGRRAAQALVRWRHKGKLAVIDGGEQLGRHAGFVGLGAGLGGAGT